MGAARTIAVHSAKGIFNALYRLFGFFRRCRRNEVLFVTRKADSPSYDYLECGKAFERQGLTPVYLARKLEARTVLPFALLVVREIYHLSRCEICVVDRYDPVVSLIDFECDGPSLDEAKCINRDFPRSPIIIQLWHAFGAFKKFGYQTLDIAEGHSSEEARLFQIHRNYSWVICSGEGARVPFSEAFACPIRRVVPFSRPTQKKLKEIARGNRAVKPGDPAMVLFAPTIRKYDKANHPVQDLIESAKVLFDEAPFEVRWSLHPLESGGEASGGVPDHLLEADYVVTDYSSIVYEAYILKKKVAFFVPDIEHYRLSPGLNADPLELCPGLCATDAFELKDMLSGWVRDSSTYPQEELEAFAKSAFEGSGEDPAEDLARFAVEELRKRGKMNNAGD